MSDETKFDKRLIDGPSNLLAIECAQHLQDLLPALDKIADEDGGNVRPDLDDTAVYDLLILFGLRFADLFQGTAGDDLYSDWLGVQLQGVNLSAAPPDAQFLVSHGRRGELRMMRWQENRTGPYRMAVTHFGPIGGKPDRFPTIRELEHAMKMWPENLPVGIPFNRTMEPYSVELWQSGPPVRASDVVGRIMIVPG